jgi:hypothetical protein
MQMRKFNSYKIDWLNHIVGFLSAIFGIFIAFRLENYRERQNDKEKVEIVKQVLKKEIEGNLEIYERNVADLSGWFDYLELYDTKFDEKRRGLVIGLHELLIWRKKQPDRFSDLKEIQSINDTLKVFEFPFRVDVAPTMGISTSNWKTAVSSGVLTSMDYTLTTRLTQIYDWTEKDIGISEEELFENFLGLGNDSNKNIADFDKIKTHYRDLTKVCALKRDQIKRIYSNIDWDK